MVFITSTYEFWCFFFTYQFALLCPGLTPQYFRSAIGGFQGTVMISGKMVFLLKNSVLPKIGCSKPANKVVFVDHGAVVLSGEFRR